MIRYIFLTSLLSFVLLYTSCSSKNNNKLRITAAASTQFVLDELVEEFTKETGVPCEVILGSSGKLFAKIKENAPYDIFVSADTIYPNQLYSLGLTEEKPVFYAQGKLVLWTLRDDVFIEDFTVTDQNISTLAISNPRHTPYGKAAWQALKNMTVFDSIISKVIIAESISQVNHFVYSNTVTVGVTSKSTVLSPEMKTVGRWKEIPQKYYDTINQSLVILKNTTHKSEAQLFSNFMVSDRAKEILSTFGYLTLSKK
ncbi:molybdate ABC transporter substrate-binding protein [Aquimarina brevivitae]|uniref:Molybdate transport system substrate-binding protein n=1 Tax=Aquimarina brevivitae TaxID=323412 RepID=A0A4Q7P1S2_9FLAO|nr:molybdate ABC transporter substrate-binding protein [Aquimarina brevivitae]RZS93675.1 molybdate transport system substrate-binding protein [Aquimarina brevivitae]